MPLKQESLILEIKIFTKLFTKFYNNSPAAISNNSDFDKDPIKEWRLI